MEEFVSNELEPRHRFLLDVLIRMALLEEELESIDDRLDPTTTNSNTTDNNTTVTTTGTNGSTSEEDTDSTTKENNGSDDGNKNNEEEEEGMEGKEANQDHTLNQDSLVLMEETAASIRALVEEQELAAQKLLLALTAEKEKRKLELIKKFANKRKMKKEGGVAVEGVASRIPSALTTPRKTEDKEDTTAAINSSSNNDNNKDVEKMTEKEIVTELSKIAVEIEVQVEKYRSSSLESLLQAVERVASDECKYPEVDESVHGKDASSNNTKDASSYNTKDATKVDDKGRESSTKRGLPRDSMIIFQLEEHENRAKRLFEELMSQKEKRAAALRARLAALRQARRVSLTDNGDILTNQTRLEAAKGHQQLSHLRSSNNQSDTDTTSGWNEEERKDSSQNDNATLSRKRSVVVGSDTVVAGEGEVGEDISDILQMTEQQAVAALTDIQDKIELQASQYRTEAMTSLMVELETVNSNNSRNSSSSSNGGRHQHSDLNIASLIERSQLHVDHLKKKLTQKYAKKIQCLKDRINALRSSPNDINKQSDDENVFLMTDNAIVSEIRRHSLILTNDNNNNTTISTNNDISIKNDTDINNCTIKNEENLRYVPSFNSQYLS